VNTLNVSYFSTGYFPIGFSIKNTTLVLFVYVMRKLIGLLMLLFLLSGCFETSLVMGPAIGGAQGKLAQSSISTALSYGVKYKTGKYPIQHILKQKKEKAVKTVSLMEEKALTTTNKIKHNLVKKPELRLVKANYKIIKAKITKLKIRTISKKIFIHEPRFSYLAR
jgi:hypothetical protein